MEGKRERAYSGFIADADLTVEDVTVIKLMEEIMEFEQEIKMK